MEEKFALKASFVRMKPKTQMTILDALSKEYKAHRTAANALLSHK